MVTFPKGEKERELRVSLIRHRQEEKRAKDLAKVRGLSYINLLEVPIEIDALALVPEGKLRLGFFAPFQKIGKKLSIAVLDPKNEIFLEVLKELREKGFEVKIFICSKTSLKRAFAEYEKVPLPGRKIVRKIEISPKELQRIKRKIKNIFDLRKELEEGGGKDSTLLLEIMLGSSLELDASDIHIEPGDRDVKIRYRIDGILYDISFFKRSIYNSLLSKVKLLSSLKLNIHDVAQDGRFTILGGKKEIEVRVSIVPGEYGEDIVMRILNPKMILSIEELGLHPWHQEILFHQIKKPTGMILTCGPTGCGKTTTLYACLTYIAKPEIKVITIENPIEYHLKGIEQTQVEPEKGYDFANALRSILRQDPDVVLVGEIRDRETADTALQAALTGHLVFSTLHTNDAAGIVPRLIEMGSSPTSIAPALNLAIAQRLLRRVCKKCAKRITPSKSLLSKIKKNLQNLPKEIKPDFKKAKFFKARGCSECHNSGYRGRIGIFEMFQISEKVEEAVLSFPSISKMKKTAIEEGMVTMQQDGLLRVLEGVTTLEELERITGPLE